MSRLRNTTKTNHALRQKITKKKSLKATQAHIKGSGKGEIVIVSKQHINCINNIIRAKSKCNPMKKHPCTKLCSLKKWERVHQLV